MNLDLFAHKQTHGFHCAACGALWDAYQVPCPMDVAIRTMDANRACITCQSPKVLVVMPERYLELQRAKAVAV